MIGLDQSLHCRRSICGIYAIDYCLSRALLRDKKGWVYHHTFQSLVRALAPWCCHTAASQHARRERGKQEHLYNRGDVGGPRERGAAQRTETSCAGHPAACTFTRRTASGGANTCRPGPCPGPPMNAAAGQPHTTPGEWCGHSAMSSSSPSGSGMLAASCSCFSYSCCCCRSIWTSGGASATCTRTKQGEGQARPHACRCPTAPARCAPMAAQPTCSTKWRLGSPTSLRARYRKGFS